MGKNYVTYQEGLKCLNLETLDDRRKSLCLKFAKGSLKNEKVRNMFPLKKNTHSMERRRIEKYRVERIKTERHKNTLHGFLFEWKLKNQKQYPQMTSIFASYFKFYIQ